MIAALTARTPHARRKLLRGASCWRPTRVSCIGGLLLLTLALLTCQYARPKGGFFSAPPPPWLSAFTTPILQPPAPPQARSPPACQDTCFKARDGVCDEVRWLASSAAASLEALCDLGTDCQDCGPWGGHLVDPSWLEWEGAHPVRPSPPGGASGYSSAPGSPAPGPVAFARHQGASVRIKRSSTQPSFLQPITSAAADPDVSAMLEGYGAREGGITRAVAEALSGHCYDPRHGSGRRLVLEVGAAQGYYALYAARLGCRVIAWEPVPLFRAFLALGVALNNLSHLVQVRGAAVSDLPSGSLVRLGVPRNGTYWALASVEDLNLHPHEVDHSIRVRTERIDDVVAAHEAVLLLKVDVEGYEPQVLSSASALLASPHLSHVLLEYSPGIAERRRNLVLAEAMLGGLLQLEEEGFALGHMPTFALAAPWPPKAMSEWYRAPMPPLEEVGMGQLYYDLQALRLRQSTEGNGSCLVPPGLSRLGAWSSCGEWARAVHPKSFRSSFGYNTNLWASRRVQRLAPGSAAARGELVALGPGGQLVMAAEQQQLQQAGSANSGRGQQGQTGASRGSGGLGGRRSVQVSTGAEGGGGGGEGEGEGGWDALPPPGPGELVLRGYASLFDAEQALSGPGASWLSLAHPGQGTGRLDCSAIGAGHQVVHHCACSRPEVCGEEEAAVRALVASGGMLFAD